MRTISVTLRRKALADGKRESLFFDYYPPIRNPKDSSKETRREYTGLRVYTNPTGPIEKDHNRHTLMLAERIRQKRENEVNRSEIYSDWERQQLDLINKGQASFIQWVENYIDGKNDEGWRAVFKYLKLYSGNNDVKFKDVTVQWCNGFREYLLNAYSRKGKHKIIKLSKNTAQSYFYKFRSVLREAYVGDKLQKDIRVKLNAMKTAKSVRQRLTLEELNLLAETPCKDPSLKTAALFCALTGVRMCDIKTLRWGQLQFDSGSGGWSLKFHQSKTEDEELLPISLQAYNILGTPGKFDDLILPGLKTSTVALNLKEWINAAGISKHITFHCFRHTFATLQLNHAGTNLAIISKMLGHKSIKTTQIYAEGSDEAMREASEKIKLNIPDSNESK